MKRDCELPWVTRVARWLVVLYGAAFALAYFVHCFMEWFL